MREYAASTRSTIWPPPWPSSTARSSGCCRLCRSPSCSGSRPATSRGRRSTTRSRVVRELNAKGKLATVDVLGEEITSADEARAIAGQYHDVLARIDAERLDANISVKLTGFGLELDARPVPREPRGGRRATPPRAATSCGSTWRTRRRPTARSRSTASCASEGHENLGVVLQAYLRRTLDDVDGLDNVRLCKGIYVEPAEIAYQEFDAVRANFVRCLERARRAGLYVGIATHDEYLIGEALRDRRAKRAAARPLRVPDAARRAPGPRRRARRATGIALRVYVPYGTQWYEYSMRRLQENPKIAGYVAADTVRPDRSPVAARTLVARAVAPGRRRRSSSTTRRRVP